MPSPTKADLEAAVQRLTEENANLRDLIAAVHAAASVPLTTDSVKDQHLADQRAREALITIRTTTDPEGMWLWSWTLPPGSDRGAAAYLRETAARLLAYKPFEGSLEAQCDADWGSATESQRCTLAEDHEGWHRDRNGHEWGEDAGWMKPGPRPAHWVDSDSGIAPCFQPGYESPDGEHACTAQPDHTGDHVTFDPDGNEVARWPQEETVTAADAIARLNPSAAEVYASHKGARS